MGTRTWRVVGSRNDSELSALILATVATLPRLRILRTVNFSQLPFAAGTLLCAVAGDNRGINNRFSSPGDKYWCLVKGGTRGRPKRSQSPRVITSPVLQDHHKATTTAEAEQLELQRVASDLSKEAEQEELEKRIVALQGLANPSSNNAQSESPSSDKRIAALQDVYMLSSGHELSSWLGSGLANMDGSRNSKTIS